MVYAPDDAEERLLNHVLRRLPGRHVHPGHSQHRVVVASDQRGERGLVTAAQRVDTVGAGDSFMAGLLVGLGDAGLLGSARRSALAQLGGDELSGAAARAAGTVAAITCG